MRYKVLSAFLIGMSLIQSACSQQVSDKYSTAIRINQIGFYPEGPKTAIVLTNSSAKFHILAPDQKVVFTGNLKQSERPALNGKTTYFSDFTSFSKTGEFQLSVENLGSSYPFSIKPGVHREVADASIKAFYYQRASAALPERYAGKWHRLAGHPDTQVYIHPSAASEKRPAGTVISATGGWYDAGDYNKYIVNSGITMGTMLSLYEDFPEYMQTVKLNIPESDNQLPDLLDEVLWNLRWMLTMQDPDDGGVYHKLTNASFDGMVMPEVTKAPRYVVQKGTAATLDFAAVTAQAARIFRKFPNQLPGLADSCITAATKAWGWAIKNPSAVYDQDLINKQFTPKIATGAYGDRNFSDEFIWAAAELYLSTQKESYYQAGKIMPDDKMPLPTWSQVRLLGYYALARNEKQLTGVAKADFPELKKRLMALADQFAEGVSTTAYQTVMGKSARDFNWGSNSNAANQGITLIQAYRLSGEKKYLDLALSNLDYIMGRNGTAFSYVTGFGSKTPMHPHHRPSVADKVTEPIPGLLVGGPNPGFQDGIKAASAVADEAFVDDDRSYASNEIAINWNAAFVYLANALEALQYKGGYSVKK